MVNRAFQKTGNEFSKYTLTLKNLFFLPFQKILGFVRKVFQGPKADSTLRSSQAVPHPSTDRALRRLTSEVERDPVHSTWYGRQREIIHSFCAGAGFLGGGCGVTSAGRGVTSAGRGITSAGRGITSAGRGITSAGRGVTSAGRGVTSAGLGVTSAGRGAGGWWRAGAMPPSLCSGEAGLASPPRGLAGDCGCALFAFSRPVKIHDFLFTSTLVPQKCWEYLLRPSRRGSLCIVSILSFLGPGRKFSYFCFLRIHISPPEASWSI